MAYCSAYLRRVRIVIVHDVIIFLSNNFPRLLGACGLYNWLMIMTQKKSEPLIKDK